MARKTYWYITIGIIAIIALAGIFLGINYILHINMDNYVIKVNGQGVPLDEFKVYMKIVKTQKEKLAGVTKPEEIKKMWSEPIEGSSPIVFLRDNALSSVVNYVITIQKGKEYGFQYSTLEETLVQQKMEEEGFISEVKSLGVSEKNIKDIFVKYAAYQKYLYNYLTKDITLSNDELSKVNQELAGKYRVRHILFLTIDENTQQELSPKEQKEALKNAEETLEKARNGEDFALLAGKYSEDPGSKDNGGECFFSKGQAVKEFEDAALKLKPGEISGIVKTVYGYHIIKREPLEGQTFESLKKEMVDSSTKDKRNKYFSELIVKWEKEAKIEKNEKLLNSISIEDL